MLEVSRVCFFFVPPKNEVTFKITI